MKTFTRLSFVLVTLICTSCQKDVSDAEDENNKKATAFRTYVQSGVFRAVDFYAETPIDYNESDNEVILETDLKKYIRNYLLDDDISFGTDGFITFKQNDVKISTNSSAEIRVPYQVRADNNGVLMDYVDDQYNPLSYYLHEQGSTYFVLSWKRPGDGVKLFSRYEMIL